MNVYNRPFIERFDGETDELGREHVEMGQWKECGFARLDRNKVVSREETLARGSNQGR